MYHFFAQNRPAELQAFLTAVDLHAALHFFSAEGRQFIARFSRN
jgi:hypothetical protein